MAALCFSTIAGQNFGKTKLMNERKKHPAKLTSKEEEKKIKRNTVVGENQVTRRGSSRPRHFQYLLHQLPVVK